MNLVTIRAFSDELTKIALWNSVKENLHAGWHGTPEAPTAWTGAGKASETARAAMSRGGRAWDTASSLGGLTKVLPVGAKALGALGTTAMVPGAIKKEDPTGRHRSRLERISGLVGNTIGGLAGGGMLARANLPGIGQGLAANLIGGIGGAYLGEKIVSAPFQARRARQLQAQPQQQVQQNPQMVGRVPA